MERVFRTAGYALTGLFLAVGLTLSAYAVAGRDLSKPAQPVRIVTPLAPKQAVAPAVAKPTPATHLTPAVNTGSSSGSVHKSGKPKSGSDGSGSDGSGSGSGSAGSNNSGTGGDSGGNGGDDGGNDD